MQSPFGGKQPVGVIYNTSMSAPMRRLRLPNCTAFEGKRESRMGAVCVVGAGLKTAIFCDTVARFFMPGPPRDANSVLPVGLAAVDPLPADSPMVLPALERKTPGGQPQYTNTIRRITDTALAEAVLRNGVIFNAEAVVVLSAPATYLAKSLDLQGAKAIYQERVKRLVIVDSGAPQQDVPALRKVLAEWPTPIIFCGKEVGGALPFPARASKKTSRGRKRIPWSMPTAPSGRCRTTHRPTTWPRPTTRCTRTPVSSSFPMPVRSPWRTMEIYASRWNPAARFEA